MEMQANDGSADLTCSGRRRFTGDLGVKKESIDAVWPARSSV